MHQTWTHVLAYMYTHTPKTENKYKGMIASVFISFLLFQAYWVSIKRRMEKRVS